MLVHVIHLLIWLLARCALTRSTRHIAYILLVKNAGSNIHLTSVRFDVQKERRSILMALQDSIQCVYTHIHHSVGTEACPPARCSIISADSSACSSIKNHHQGCPVEQRLRAAHTSQLQVSPLSCCYIPPPGIFVRSSRHVLIPTTLHCSSAKSRMQDVPVGVEAHLGLVPELALPGGSVIMWRCDTHAVGVLGAASVDQVWATPIQHSACSKQMGLLLSCRLDDYGT